MEEPPEGDYCQVILDEQPTDPWDLVATDQWALVSPDANKKLRDTLLAATRPNHCPLISILVALYSALTTSPGCILRPANCRPSFCAAWLNTERIETQTKHKKNFKAILIGIFIPLLKKEMQTTRKTKEKRTRNSKHFRFWQWKNILAVTHVVLGDERQLLELMQAEMSLERWRNVVHKKRRKNDRKIGRKV